MEPTEEVIVDWKSEENHLFLNPRFSDEIQSHYNRVFRETTYRHAVKSHIAFLTSGTTVVDPKSYKMVFLSKAAFLSSAQGVTKNLFISAKDIWIQCLPRFHVGGLAIEARAHLVGFKVERFNKPWNPAEFAQFIVDTKATWASLVPTQVFDLVHAKIANPSPKFRALVGGARLSSGLMTQAKELGWSLVPSYGMTEASSTIALIENEILKPFPHVYLDVIDGKLAIKTPSLFSFYAQVIKGQIEIQKPALQPNGLFLTEDSASKVGGQKIMLLGRSQDVVKISGELVSLPKLRDLWFSLSHIDKALSYYVMAVPDARVENKIILIIQPDLLANSKVKPSEYQLAANVAQSLGEYQGQVLPFEKIREVYVVDRIPRTDLGKVQEKSILQMIEKGDAYEIREHRLE